MIGAQTRLSGSAQDGAGWRKERWSGHWSPPAAAPHIRACEVDASGPDFALAAHPSKSAGS